ncbi:IS1634 family transposase [Galactobacillus timonensis]|uniref:IS1634 family transposase n=1 Tax=Galactobacillus timonensis TaxID=2041840 RepID=UPI000C84984E|nr:IS1634 family transposase [Galactobacillus timonensis]
MAYFLKKTLNKKGTYLQIYSSFYDPVRGHTAHRSYKAIGYVDELKKNGIDDPIAYYSKEVDDLNRERKKQRDLEKTAQISDTIPTRYLGYFPVKSVNSELNVADDIRLLQAPYNLHFDAANLLFSLVYARIVSPCSKHKTYFNVLPCMYDTADCSLDQLYNGVDFFGKEYQKIIEIYTAAVRQKYSYDVSHVYFDCTNFYFEIDRENDLCLKGPSKENKTDPIVGMGLLLDANRIPVGMEIFPGNESEKPVIRSVVNELKTRHNIAGRTIRIADKGLNCSANIIDEIANNDGYIFSKSVKQLPETEKTWVLLEKGWDEVRDKRGNLLYKSKSCIDEFSYTITDAKGRKRIVKLTEKRVATYNPGLAEKQTHEINRLVEKAKYMRASEAKKSEYGESSKYVIFKSTDSEGNLTSGKIQTELNTAAIEKDKKLAGYNLLVTSEVKMKDQEIYEAYHNLWRIEESFRIMKSELDARPVFLQKADRIKGHFLICYLAILLMRILQFKILDNAYSSQDIMNFMKSFQVIKISEHTYFNNTRSSDFICALRDITSLPLTNCYLKKSDVTAILNYKFPSPIKKN